MHWYGENESSVALEFWVRCHVVVGNHQNKYENTKKIGKEAQVLIINHLLQKIDKSHISLVTPRESRSLTAIGNLQKHEDTTLKNKLVLTSNVLL